MPRTTYSSSSPEYWNQTIAEWDQLYVDSNNNHNAIRGISRFLLYPRWIRHLEAKTLALRLQRTRAFIDEFVTPASVVADLGCGAGRITVELLRRGAVVKAVDFAQEALALTRRSVTTLAPEHSSRVEYICANVCSDLLPASDIALALGVTPYVRSLDEFYGNILPSTKLFFCLNLDMTHWANVLREQFPLLNAHGMRSFDMTRIDDMLQRHGWRLLRRDRCGTGWLDVATRS